MKCRFCKNELKYEFIDLTSSPPSNSFLTEAQLNEAESFFPLKLYVCEKCWLVQIDEYIPADKIFCSGYVYFSSYSRLWLEHAKNYVEMITKNLKLDKSSKVIEIASNDGYLLQYFLKKNIPCLGIEPAERTAMVAREAGIPVIGEFFGEELSRQMAKEGNKADLIIANNVLAHVPNISDFVSGLKIILKSCGVITIEFPHLKKLIERNEFDTIYHEHLFYFSFHAIKTVFTAYDLEIYHVEELATHGGSLRIYAKHAEDRSKCTNPSVAGLIEREKAVGMLQLDYYLSFQELANQVKYAFLSFLLKQKIKRKIVIGYGAAAKGNTLMNYCGVKKDLIKCVVDASPYKQGKYLPGSHIPVVNEDKIRETKPDYVIILPWNIKDEIMEQISYIREWGGKFVIPIPQLQILSPIFERDFIKTRRSIKYVT